MEDIKLLIIGCGSIGRRYAGNSVSLTGVDSVAVYDRDVNLAKSLSTELGVHAFASLEEALAWMPNAVIVATPHRSHREVTEAALDIGAIVLVEKPISDSLNDAEAMVSRSEAVSLPLFTVCNMRYHPAIKTLKEHISKIGIPYFARAHYGNYLPDMRPGADYRKLYCSRRETGGGVIFDAVHEIDYITWLLGQVTNIVCDAGHISNLDLDVEDYAVLLMQHGVNTRSEIHLDYLQRFKRRGCEIIGSEGTLLWESLGKNPEYCTVRIFQANKGVWETLFEDKNLDANISYRKMLEDFVGALNNKPNKLHSGVEATEVLKIAQAAIDSAKNGCRLEMATKESGL